MTSIRIEKLARHHVVTGFDCGQQSLDEFLTQFALANQLASASQTYLLLAKDEVIGYYTLVVGAVGYEDAPARLAKGLARHPIPLMILARMAISLHWQGKGLGSGLIKDAMQRTMVVAEIAGVRAMAVHAKDEEARAFYSRFGFEPSPIEQLHLYMLVKDLQRAMNAP